MVKTSASSRGQAPRGRRTILLDLPFGIERLVAGVYDYARDAGWSVLDLRYYHPTASSRASHPDGAIIDTSAGTSPLAKRFIHGGVPLVRLRAMFPDICCVVADQRAIGRAAAEHFGQRGFKSAAYLHSNGFDDSPFRLTGLSFIERARELVRQRYFGSSPIACPADGGSRPGDFGRVKDDL